MAVAVAVALTGTVSQWEMMQSRHTAVQTVQHISTCFNPVPSTGNNRTSNRKSNRNNNSNHNTIRSNKPKTHTKVHCPPPTLRKQLLWRPPLRLPPLTDSSRRWLPVGPRSTSAAGAGGRRRVPVGGSRVCWSWRWSRRRGTSDGGRSRSGKSGSNCNCGSRKAFTSTAALPHPNSASHCRVKKEVEMRVAA
jgi:hypothetical protein